MARMIRCIEGHVFDGANGQCPVCGWHAPGKASFNDRLRRSIPTGKQIRQALADGGAVRTALAHSIVRLADHDHPRAGSDDAVSGDAFKVNAPDTLMRLVSSRTVWFVLATVGLIGVFILELPTDEEQDFNFIYLLAGLIVTLFAFGIRSFLRSNVPIILLIFAVLVEYAFMERSLLPVSQLTVYESCQPHLENVSTFFWYWAAFWKYLGQWGCPESRLPPGQLGTLSSITIGIGVPEDTAKLAPVIVLLLIAWVIKALPAEAISSATKAKIIAWCELDRASTLLMVAFAGGVGFVLFETLGQYLNTMFNKTAIPIGALVRATPNYVAGGFPVALANGAELSLEQWRTSGLYIAQHYGLMNGLMLTIPRTIGLLTGHGAFAAIVAYYLALARRQSIIVGIGLVIIGIGISATLHGLWDRYASATLDAPLAMLSVVVLLAVCVQAVALDERAGFKNAAVAPGRSIAFHQKIPDFPANRPIDAAARSTPASFTAVPLATLVIEGGATMPGRRVPLHRNSGRIELAAEITCEIRPHPSDASKVGLKNLTAHAWTLTMPDGRAVEVLPQKSAVLAKDAVIDFGPFRGRIELA